MNNAVAADAPIEQGRTSLDVERIKNRSDFLRVARVGARWVEPGLVLQAAKRQERGEDLSVRVGFTVSKKVGGAVARNRARRRLKAAAAQVVPHLAQPAIDYVIIGRHTTLARPFALLVEDLKTAVSKVKIRDSK